jgi:osmotically-inducible protein OsmY
MTITDVPSAHSLHATIRGKFRNSGIAELRQVRIAGNAESLTLTGTVPTYYAKAMATSLALMVPGVLHLSNEIVVG